jgi:hypothetical protein
VKAFSLQALYDGKIEEESKHFPVLPFSANRRNTEISFTRLKNTPKHI